MTLGLYILLLILVFIIMAIGLAGTIIPILPGTPVIFIAILLYGIITNFVLVDGRFLLLVGVLGVIPLVLHYVLAPLGARRFGASRWGMFGAFTGAVIGLFVLFPAGVFIWATVCAILLELVVTGNVQRSLKAGLGSFVGFIISGITHFAIGLSMIVLFITRIL